IIIFFVLVSLSVSGQELVTFYSTDSLKISAHLYEQDANMPYMILLHQAGYSKGEYKETAPRLMNLGYNCLAVDLRSGDQVNFIQNETAKEAKRKNLPTNYLDARKDIEAAIQYAYQKSKKPVVLVGSSYSASLALILAKSNEKVKAVVAFSPGEYFGNELKVQSQLKNFDKPVLVACTQREYPYVVELTKYIPEHLKTIFKPQEGQGEHGSKALWNNSPTSKEYWLSILMFFNKHNGKN
ncbi:MAG: dienelactone hydrolase family protein, partial [Bacteroidales bacterium]|nr:dienelactone hydrolase family protein [Bacteroidales bacterium]